MQFKRPRGDEAFVGLAALKYLALGESAEIGPAERGMMAAVQQAFDTHHDLDRIEPLGPDEVAARIVDPQIREQLVCALIVGSMIDGEATASEAKVVDRFARALGVQEKSVADLRHLSRHQHLVLRFDLMRRFWAIEKLRERIREEGLGAAVNMIRATAGRFEDPAMARRFLALRSLPDGTLGREYLRFLARNGWPLPGEKGAQSDIIVTHDMTHVLGEYGTDPAGEVETACFTAGHRRKEPFTMVMFVLLQFHAGVRMTPGAKAERGFFDVGRALAAIERGAAMNVDLSEGWSYWDVIDVPVEELRRRYGIPPRAGCATLGA
jgi:hypothetical protein